MKINIYGEPTIVMDNPLGLHNYFGWPTAARLRNGRIAVTSSGFRLGHVCPFGKTVISFSNDDGKTYTLPTPVIDTCLDDRDGGLCAFGESGLILTSFNNSANWQRQLTDDPYKLAYLDKIPAEKEAEVLGATFRISYDNGVTFSKIYRSPISSPHGPCELADGTILWVGNTFDGVYTRGAYGNDLHAYTINPENGEMTYVGEIENIVTEDGQKLSSYEPHTIELDNGTLLTHIRVEDGNNKVFTIYQSKSTDGGKTWTKPVQILTDKGGAPAHIFKHSSGTLICTYGYREKPTGIKVMFSNDNGETWDTDYDLNVNGISNDIGYPSTVELPDKSLLTIYYGHNTHWQDPAIIMQIHWSFEE